MSVFDENYYIFLLWLLYCYLISESLCESRFLIIWLKMVYVVLYWLNLVEGY